MKCKLQVFTKRVSAALFTASLTGNIKTRSIQHMARFFEILNYLFDNLNSRSVNDPTPMKRAISYFNNIRQNLVDNLMYMRDWYVISANNLKTPPCFLGFIQFILNWFIRDECTAHRRFSLFYFNCQNTTQKYSGSENN